MAEPIIIVKEGSLTIEVRKRATGSTGQGEKVLEVTIPGNIKPPPGTKPSGKKGRGFWRITWEKPPRKRPRPRR